MGRSAGAGGAGEGLGDVEPVVGLVALGVDVEVVAVGALGDEDREVPGGPGDALGGVLGTVRPGVIDAVALTARRTRGLTEEVEKNGLRLRAPRVGPLSERAADLVRVDDATVRTSHSAVQRHALHVPT